MAQKQHMGESNGICTILYGIEWQGMAQHVMVCHGMTWYGMVLDGMRKLTNSEAGVMAQGQHTVTQGKESEQRWWRMNP